jgi:hypothetical protein
MSNPIKVTEDFYRQVTVEPRSCSLPPETTVAVFFRGRIVEVKLGTLEKGAKFHFRGQGWRIPATKDKS